MDASKLPRVPGRRRSAPCLAESETKTSMGEAGALRLQLVPVELLRLTLQVFLHSLIRLFCRLAAIEAIHRCKRLCLIRSLPIKSGEVQPIGLSWVPPTEMLVPASYRRAVTPLCEVLHAAR